MRSNETSGRRYRIGGEKPGILVRQKAFRDGQVQHDRQDKRERGDDQRHRPEPQHNIEGDPVKIGQRVQRRFREPGIPGRPRAVGSRAQQTGAHHGGERQRDDHRGQHRDGKRQRELAEKPAHDARHEQERDEHRDERNGQRHDGEADLARAFIGRFHRLIAILDMAHDVFDHHDGVVDDEAGRDGERHER